MITPRQDFVFRLASSQVLPVYTVGNGTHVQITSPMICDVGHDEALMTSPGRLGPWPGGI